MAEFVQHDGEGEAALDQALLLVEAPAAAVDVERADALGVAEGRILRVEIGAVICSEVVVISRNSASAALVVST